MLVLYETHRWCTKRINTQKHDLLFLQYTLSILLPNSKKIKKGNTGNGSWILFCRTITIKWLTVSVADRGAKGSLNPDTADTKPENRQLAAWLQTCKADEWSQIATPVKVGAVGGKTKNQHLWRQWKPILTNTKLYYQMNAPSWPTFRRTPWHVCWVTPPFCSWQILQ